MVLGSLLALLSGVLNAAAAALEKREGMRTATGEHGLRLLAALARRPSWLLAMALSAVAWACEATALATAPVPVVATLRNAGRGLLVVGGGRWLGERFRASELVGVGLASAGAATTAIGAANSPVERTPLSNWTELAVAAVCVAAAWAVVRVASWLATRRPGGLSEGQLPPGQLPSRRRNAAGVAMGTAVGLLFAGTGVFTKEIGDRFALYGVHGIASVVASASPWLMVAMAIWSQSLIQQAFRWANAATVSAANASVASVGLIAAGFALYGEPVPKGPSAWLLFVGIAVALLGMAMLLGTAPSATATGGQLERSEVS